MQHDVEVVTGTEDFLPQITPSPRVIQRLLEHAITEQKLTTYVDEGQMAIDRKRGDDDAFDELVGVAFHDDAVLACTRLTFIRIATKINGFSRVFRHETPFHPCGKAGTAAATQSGGFGRFDDVFRTEFFKNLFSGFVPTKFNIAVNLLHPRIVNVLKKDTFIRHKKRL